ncbi:MAG: capsid cement protein [Opitutaceae bacterium]|jgi:hypothetical protein
MITLYILLSVLFVALLGIGYRSRHAFCDGGLVFSNNAPRAMATHRNPVTRAVDAVVATRFLLAKSGATAMSSAICGASDRPIGVYDDVAAAIGDIITLRLLGINAETLLMVPSVNVSAGDPLYTAANGKVTNISTTGAYVVGFALTDGITDGIVEVDPRPSVAAVS